MVFFSVSSQNQDTSRKVNHLYKFVTLYCIDNNKKSSSLSEQIGQNLSTKQLIHMLERVDY